MGVIDRAPVDLTNPDAAALVHRLPDFYWTEAAITGLALYAGVKMSSVTLNQPAATLWRDLVVVASSQNRLRALVVEIQKDVNSAAPDLRALLARLLSEPPETLQSVVAPPAVSKEVFESVLLWDDLPFIGREDLRGNLKLMVGREGRRALLVMGTPGSGKTYTRQFIHYLTDNGGPRRVRAIDLSSRAGPPIEVRELASVIARTLLDKDPPTFDPTAQAETVVGLFKAWLINAVDALEEPAWLVFDGFTSTTASGAAIQLVNELALAAAARDLGKVRVVVLGFGGNPAHAAQALCEPLKHPSRDDVKVFFGKVAASLQEGASPDDEALEVLLNAFTQKEGPIESRPLADLGPSALAQARAVFGAQA